MTFDKNNDNIFGKSRYGDMRYYTTESDGSIIVYGKSEYVRQGEGMFDFEGGPFINAGDPLLSDKGKMGTVKDVVYFDEGPDGFTACKVTLK